MASIAFLYLLLSPPSYRHHTTCSIPVSVIRHHKSCDTSLRHHLVFMISSSAPPASSANTLVLLILGVCRLLPLPLFCLFIVMFGVLPGAPLSMIIAILSYLLRTLEGLKYRDEVFPTFQRFFSEVTNIYQAKLSIFLSLPR